MELILEILAEVLLDGSLEIVTEKKLPMWLRFVAGTILSVVYGGLMIVGVLLTISGIERADVLLMVVGVSLAGLMVSFGVMLYRKLRHRH